MKEFKYNAPEYNLPDAFKKDPSSNNYKLLHINTDTENGISETFKQLFKQLDIDNAFEKNLDMYGEMFSVSRKGDNDDKYRIRIKAQIGHNYTDGSRKSTADVVAWLLQSDTSEIRIKSGDATGDVIISGIPLPILMDAGFEREEITELINSLLSVCVRVKTASYVGTLEFADDVNAYDSSKGFADDNSNIGGYFGIDDNFTEVKI